MATQNESRNPYVAALERAVAELDDRRREAAALRQDLALLERRSRRLYDSIGALLPLLPPDVQARFRDQDLDQAFAAPPLEHAGNASADYGAILDILAEAPGREWTAGSLRRALHRGGHNPSAKYVYNTLHRLAQKGVLVKLQRGIYALAVAGAPPPPA